MSRYFLLIGTLLLLAYPYNGSAQSKWHTFSADVQSSPDSAVVAIADVWKGYVEEVVTGGDGTRFFKQGTDDVIKYINAGSTLYRFGNQYTFNIRKATDDVYEINTMAKYNTDSVTFNVLGIYKTCAVKVDDEYKLISYFDVNRGSYGSYSTGDIDYYFPFGTNFDKVKADSAAIFLTDFKREYGVASGDRVRYVMGRSIDEGAAMVGFSYTPFRSEKWYAGLTIPPRTVLSTRENHIHELVHTVMLLQYPSAPTVLQEGIATLYGGGANKSFDFHVRNLKQYMKGNSIDFGDEKNLYKQIGETYVVNAVGGIMVEYVCSAYGLAKVLQMFETKKYEQIFSVIGVETKDINDFILTIIESYD